MAPAKMKNDSTPLTLKVVKNTASRDFHDEGKDLWLGMERRKFSYTIHIPERRSIRNQKMPKSTKKNPKHHTKG